MVLFTKPGPDMIALVSRSLANGFKPAMALLAGTVVAQWVYIGFVFFSYSLSQDIILFIEILFKTIGAALFIYMGCKGLQHLESGLWQKRSNSKPFILENFWSGLSICLGNPLIFFFYTALLPTFLNMATFSIYNLIYACIMVAVFNGGPGVVVALMASRVRNILKNPGTLKNINLITSCLFILLGLFIGATAITQFDVQALYFSAEKLYQTAYYAFASMGAA